MYLLNVKDEKCILEKVGRFYAMASADGAYRCVFLQALFVCRRQNLSQNLIL